MEVLLWTLRATALTGGILVCYASAFLYEDEEREIQNALEVWWVRIDDWRHLALSKHTAVVIAIATLTRTALNKLFGEKILSLRSICTSISLSYGSLAVPLIQFAPSILSDIRTGRAVAYGYSPNDIGVAQRILLVLIGCSLASLLLVAIGCLKHFRLAPVISAAGLWVVYAFYGRTTLFGSMRATAIFAMVFLLSGLWYALGIVIFRTLIKWQSTGRELVRVYGAGIFAALVVFALTAGTLATGRFLFHIGLQRTGMLLGLLSSMSLGLAATGALFATSAIALCVHRVMWPVVERPLYQLARTGILRTSSRRAALFVAGTTAVALACGLGGDVRNIVRLLLTSA